MKDAHSYWHADNFTIVDEPLLLSLLKYRQRKNRWPVMRSLANLVSSRTVNGKQMMILDLDFPKFRILKEDITHLPHRIEFLDVHDKDADRLVREWRKAYLLPAAVLPRGKVRLALPEYTDAIPSTSEGHLHLYVNEPISWWRWAMLMRALYKADLIELGFYVWSMRRGGNFVRLPGLKKSTAPEENTKASYGWIFKLKAP